VQLGRGPEAVPVFLSLAEQLAADGFTARAIAALKRIEKLEPGRPDVEARVADLARLGRSPSMLPGIATTPVPAPRAAPPKTEAFRLDLEEVGTETLARRDADRVDRARRLAEEVLRRREEEARETAGPNDAVIFEPVDTEPERTADVAPTTAAPSAEHAAPVGALPTEGASAAPVSAEAASGSAAPAAVPPEPPESPPAAAPASSSPAARTGPVASGPPSGGVADRLRGVFRRFLAALPASSPASEGADAAAPPITSGATTTSPAGIESSPVVSAVTPETPGVTAEPPGLTSEGPGITPPEGEKPSHELREDDLPSLDDIEEVVEEVIEEVIEEIEAGLEPIAASEPAVVPAGQAAGDAAPAASTVSEDTAKLPRETVELLTSTVPIPRPEPKAVPEQPAAVSAEPLPEPAPIERPAADEAPAIEVEPIPEPVASSPAPPAKAAPVATAPEPPAIAAPSSKPATRAGELDAFLSLSQDAFDDQVADLIGEMLSPGAESEAPGAEPPAGRSLLTGPLFDGLTDDERVALVRGLKLRTFEPGDVILTEGSVGNSLFLLTAGAVKVFVRNPAGGNRLLDDLAEGDFFGEISTLSGRPRNATITAAALCELLELDHASLAEIATSHPSVGERLESFSQERAASREAVALRRQGTGAPETNLETRFDDGHLEPRLRLRLADAFLKAGQEREAAQVLIDLADDLVRRGQNEKAVALLKKVEQLQRRPAGAGRRPAAASHKGPTADSDDRLRDWLIDMVRDTVRRRSAVASRAIEGPPAHPLDPASLRKLGRGLVASPLFEGLSEDELLALVQGLELRMFEPGDVVLTEGEPGQSVFIVATGLVKVFIRNRAGQDEPLRQLGEGAFFGEISALSGRSRTASVTAATPCALLELDHAALRTITRAYPRVQEILETVYIERAGDSTAEAIRTHTGA
jgi:CRP-like cAMP-binding protein